MPRRRRDEDRQPRLQATQAPQGIADHAPTLRQLIDRVQTSMLVCGRVTAEAREMSARAHRARQETSQMRMLLGKRLEELVRRESRGAVPSLSFLDSDFLVAADCRKVLESAIDAALHL